MSQKLRTALTATLFLLPALASAHPGHGATGFAGGFAHPFSGFDHLLAMVAVGIWGVQRGGRAIWALPLAFIAVMVLGGVIGISGLQLPGSEQAIIGSVLLFGVFITASVRLPIAVGVVVVGVLALFHGFAHGAEMAAGSNALSYVAGFVVATLLLHGAGVAAAIAMQRISKPIALRWAGVAVALCGLWMIAG